jgi:hypothetical protein
MGISATDICNLALIELGAAPISNPNDISVEAANVQAFYQPMLSRLLREHTWKFAIHRAHLQRHVSEFDCHTQRGYGLRSDLIGPRFYVLEGDHPSPSRFALPIDFIRLLKVLHPHEIHYDIEGRDLLAHTHHCEIQYVRSVDNANLFDSHFVDCLSLLISHKAAYAITGSSNRAAEQLAKYQDALQTAKRINGQERTLPFVVSNKALFASRYSGWGPNIRSIY